MFIQFTFLECEYVCRATDISAITPIFDSSEIVECYEVSFLNKKHIVTITPERANKLIAAINPIVIS